MLPFLPSQPPIQHSPETVPADSFHPLMEQLKINRTPHCCRHTCISMLAEAGVDQTIIKKIMGHSGAMTLTEKVYTHYDVKELVETRKKDIPRFL